jgi:CheY-like chemotaxis protein
MPCHNLILIVEDDAAVRDAMRLVLEMAGYTVKGVPNGREALDYLRQNERPCVILLDLLTPDMDGWEFRRQQLENPRLADIPVVIVSGKAAVQDEAKTLNVAGFIQKPIEVPALLGTVRLFAMPRKPEVLLVASREAVADLLASALRQYGVAAHRATSSQEAVELYRQNRGVALVLLDAEALGAELAATLATFREINPAVQCCFLNEEMQRPGVATGAVKLPNVNEAARLIRQLIY